MPGGVDAGLEGLREYFTWLDTVLVAFSGGVDSSVLAKVSHDVLGDRALAVTLVSPVSDPGETESAMEVAKHIGVRHVVAEHNELSNKDFTINPDDRCYHCKKGLSLKLWKIAGEHGIRNIVEGTTLEDLRGHRPGFKAVREAGLRSPLMELGLSKSDVRLMAERLGLPNAGRPSTACLASRIPYGTEITEGLLGRISRAESFVRSLGVGQVRVRCFGDVAVLEVSPVEFGVVVENGAEVSEKLVGLGFKRVTLDLGGYRAGSMNHS